MHLNTALFGVWWKKTIFVSEGVSGKRHLIEVVVSSLLHTARCAREAGNCCEGSDDICLRCLGVRIRKKFEVDEEERMRQRVVEAHESLRHTKRSLFFLSISFFFKFARYEGKRR